MNMEKFTDPKQEGAGEYSEEQELGFELAGNAAITLLRKARKAFEEGKTEEGETLLRKSEDAFIATLTQTHDEVQERPGGKEKLREMREKRMSRRKDLPEFVVKGEDSG